MKILQVMKCLIGPSLKYCNSEYEIKNMYCHKKPNKKHRKK